MRNGFPVVARLLVEHDADLTIRGAVALADVPRIRALVSADPLLFGRLVPKVGFYPWRSFMGTLSCRLLLDLALMWMNASCSKSWKNPTLAGACRFGMRLSEPV